MEYNVNSHYIACHVLKPCPERLDDSKAQHLSSLLLAEALTHLQRPSHPHTHMHTQAEGYK